MALNGIIGSGVSLRGIHQELFHYTFNLKTGIVAADVGKAVTIDTAAANTMKLASDGDPIFGRLETVEDRSVEGILTGTIATSGGLRFWYDPDLAGGSAPAIGEMLVGAAGTSAGDGYVDGIAPYVDTDGTGSPVVTRAKHTSGWFITEVDTTAKTVIAVKF